MNNTLVALDILLKTSVLILASATIQEAYNLIVLLVRGKVQEETIEVAE